MSVSDTWPMRRPRPRPAFRLPRALLLGAWPLLAGVGLTTLLVAVELLRGRASLDAIAVAPRLFAERFIDLPLAPHSTPLQLGGGPLLVFLGVTIAAALSGRRLFMEKPGQQPALTVALAGLPFLLACLALAAADSADAPAGPLAAVLRPLVPALWVAGALAGGTAWQSALMGRRRRQVSAARGFAAGALGAAVALAALAAITFGSAAAQMARQPRSGQAWVGSLAWLMDSPNAGGALLASNRHGLGGGVSDATALLVVLAVLVIAGLCGAIFLLTTGPLEVAAFIATFTTLLAVMAVGSRPQSGSVAAIFAAQLPFLLFAAAAAGLAGPALASLPGAGRVRTWRPLQAFGDRLPPPVASPIGAGPVRLQPGWRPLALVATAALLAEAGLLLTTSHVPPARPLAPEPPSPLQLVAQRYLAASARGDAAAAWAEIVVDEPPGESGAVRLVDAKALAAMYANPGARGEEPVKLHLLTRRVAGQDVAAEFSAGPHGERRPALILRKVPANVWKVVIRAGTAEIALAQPAPLAFDGIPLPARQSYRLLALPGPHVVSAGDGRVQRAETSSVQVGSATTVRLQLAPTFTAEATASANRLVNSALTACAASAAAAPAGCLQSAPVPAPVTWRLVGDPAATLSPSGSLEQGFIAIGRYQYIAAYRVHVPEGIAHAAATGAYRLPLRWTEAGFVTAGGLDSPPAVPAARPAADEPGLHRAVTAGLQGCAAATLLRPPDCPNGLPSTRFVTPVSWRLLSDPAAQAAAEFDPASGEFHVTGTFQMAATYTEGGLRKSGIISSGNYRATLLWDGTAPVLVDIRATQ